MIKIFINRLEYDKACSSIKVGEKCVWLFNDYDKQEIFTMVLLNNGRQTIRLDEKTCG